MIDADEALDDVLREAILRAPENVNGYEMRRTTYFCGKPLRIWRGESLLRLFRTQAADIVAKGAARSGAPLHERWVCEEPRGELAGTLLHFCYPDRTSYRVKFERYTDVEAAALAPSRMRVVGEWLAIWPRLLRLLFVKGSVLDGFRGIVAAYGSARYRYVSARKALH